MHRRTGLAALALAWLAATGAYAQDYPTRPIRLVVGFAPGGAIDDAARTVAQQLSGALGQQVVVDNRPGASSTLAADLVAGAPADGYTLLFGSTSMIIARYMQLQRGNRPANAFDLVKSFAPVASVATSPLTVAVTPSFPAKDPEGFVREVRNHPGQYFYATSGVGSLHHLGMEQLMKQLGLQMTHVPYKGASRIMPDLISGQVKIGVVSAASVASQEREGRLRVIGLLNDGKLATMPQWHSFAEVAPGFSVLPKMFILAPAGTPAHVVSRLDRELKTALQAPELLDAFTRQGSVASYAPAATLKAEVVQEDRHWGQVVRDMGLKSQ